MLPAVAVADALSGAMPAPAAWGIKWMNDIVVDDKKIAGCLTATRIREERVEDVLFGIGINVAAAPEIDTEQGNLPAGCLHDIGGCHDLTCGNVLKSVTEALARGLDRLLVAGPAMLYTDYRARSCILGRKVDLWPVEGGSDPFASGIVRDIDANLRLHLDTEERPIEDARITFPSRL
jgi:biotin-(acetyl-CoA carboxylase) ligase